jgi:CheY-like chemotaxis protein
MGVRVRSVEDGLLALDALAEAEDADAPYDVVLLDYHMPKMDGMVLAEEIRKRFGATPALVLLTSSGKRGDSARCQRIGIGGYLTKPVFSADLIGAIQAVLRDVPETKERPIVTRHSLREDRHRVRILLAEDNNVNSRVATVLLERLGYEVVHVENGRLALERYRSERFDVILMDLQMPEMDGIEAVAAIRADEAATGTRVPIVALTAHAMKGDRERCIAAGMDGYASKPFKSSELVDQIQTVMGTKPAEEARSEAA